ncbi:trace amine-associated receptor 1-like [Erpetoichthys calabaricus]|uniref:trace amine-associated receptor 1-like n=1 Tax=Erpetoichthys calabaricus TaxID=27687 RepID=UPI0010A0ADC0|nr:trace amine-associated receptor 1-like [Erpetoichthys calabaricus]
MNISYILPPDIVYFCYESINNSCYKELRPPYFPTLLYTVMWTVILLTIFGNLLVIISISHFKQLHSPTNYLILSLAVTDLLMGGFVMPPTMSQLIDGCWYYGEFFCKFYFGTVIMLCTASIIHLSVISLDRYYAVCHPLSYKAVITVSVTLHVILISWILSALTGYIIIFLELNMKGIEHIYRNRCIGSCILVQNEASGLVSSLLSFYIPGFIMICIYLKIFKVAKRQAKSIKDLSQHIQTNEQKKDAALQKKETKAAKTLAIVLGVFLVCWLPFFLCNIINPILNHPAPPTMTDVLAWIGYMNSTFNPLVYGFFYTWFRKCLKIIALGKIFKADSSRTKLFAD